MIIVGADTGGTFTDFVYKDGGRWGVYKIPSTPWNPAEALVKGIRHIAHGRKRQIIHGSTVATNAILERKGAKTALITNRGFEDILEIGRQNRSRLYDLSYRKQPPLIPQALRFGVKGRILNTGEELQPLDENDVREAIRKVVNAGAESVAVCLLFSYANPAHEKRIGKLLAPEPVSTSLSHEILSEFREFERFSTTAINAYVSPKMSKYISSLMEQLDQGDILRIMQSNGGSISGQTAMRESVRTILSGPAGGAVGAYEIGKAAGYKKLITFDMGGTSTDVCLVDGALSLTVESNISGYPIKVPMLDIHTVGAGGGSIAYLDEGGSLRVGPESAGADPGPICYGKGDRITVTDANLYLGRLIPQYFLGGNMRLEEHRLEGYFQQMAKRAGLEKVELAEGILDIANTSMERAIRVISVERGYDPREFVLFSFGGAGGMHAAFLARLLNIPKVVVPENPGILSAIGMLMADVIKDYSYTIMKNQLNTTREELSRLFQSLEERGKDDLATEGISRDKMVMERYLDMRYQGQSYEIMVPFEGDYIERFHLLHEKTYGYRNEGKTVELVNVRLRARGIPEKPRLPRYEIGPEAPVPEAIVAERNVIFEGKKYRTLVYSREKLVSGNVVKGPAIIVEYSSTTVIPPFATVMVDEFRNLIIEVKA